MSWLFSPVGASASRMTGSRISISLRVSSRRWLCWAKETMATSRISDHVPVRLEGGVGLVERLDVADVGEAVVPLLLGDPLRLDPHPLTDLVDPHALQQQRGR